MSHRDSPCLQLLERAYSYLRLTGASEVDCCRHVQWLAGELAESMTGGTPPAEVVDALWARLMPIDAMDEERSEPLAPPPVRGSIGYARFGGRAR
jgi:hypothetical protein